MNIPVICGSIRNSRLSIHPTRYINQKLKMLGHESMVVDFLELPLPFVYTEPAPGDLGKQYPDPNVQKWSAIADAADAFIIVTPEYNHGYPGVLKNALDWLFPEYKNKPVGLVGVSNGLVGGARAIEHLRPIIENFTMFAVRETVMFRKAQDVFDKDGKLLDASYDKSIDGLLASVIKVAGAMQALRNSK